MKSGILEIQGYQRRPTLLSQKLGQAIMTFSYDEAVLALLFHVLDAPGDGNL